MTGDLPHGWAWAELGSIADTQLGKMLSAKARHGHRPMPYLRNQNVQWHNFDLSDVAEMDYSEAESIKYELRPGDLLVCEGGEVGRCAVWSRPHGKMHFQKALHRVRPLAGTGVRWIEYFLRWSAETGRFGDHASGSTISHLPQRDLRRLHVPVPPTAEQERIVAAIEEHFSRLDAVEAALIRDLARLCTLRSSLLTTAFKAAGDLPDGWRWSRIAAVATLVRGVTFKRPEALGTPGPGLVPIARAGNLEPGRTILDRDLVYVPQARVAPEQYLQAGDVLIATSSGSLSVVGKSALVGKDWHGAHGAFMSVLRSHGSLSPSYLGYWVQSEPVRARWRLAAAGTNINNLKRDDLLSTPIPICPLEEQKQVVAAVEQGLLHIDAAGVARNTLETLAALRRSILARAFAGHLVTQNPRDEPASLLLERIRASRLARPKRQRLRT